ncbi:50S ribosomal protein L11 methyltransferase [Bdellovibrionota bacterium]
MSWSKLSILLPVSAAEEVSSVLVNLGSSGVEEIWSEPISIPPLSKHLTEEEIEGAKPQSKSVTIEAYFKDLTEKKLEEITNRLRKMKSIFSDWKNLEIKRTSVKEEDWLEKWKTNFHALRVGKRIVVAPSWETGDFSEKDCVITLDPGMAFGTGHHPTTEGCLTLLEKYIDTQNPKNLLDVGTGSGILAITAAKLGVSNVVANDIDKDAISTAQENACRNGVDGNISFSCNPLPKIPGIFSIVVANILSTELKNLSNELSEKVSPGCPLILSGILCSESSEIKDLFLKTYKFSFIEEIPKDEWITIAFRREN